MAAATSPEAPVRRADHDEKLAKDGVGRPAGAPSGAWRDRVRSKPGVREVYRFGVFVAGLVFIAGGAALAVLPGPLTIPPVLIGLWIWSTEFPFARRLFDKFKVKARDAWTHAKAHPLSSAAITVGGLVAAGFVMWAVGHFELIDKAKNAIS